MLASHHLNATTTVLAYSYECSIPVQGTHSKSRSSHPATGIKGLFNDDPFSFLLYTISYIQSRTSTLSDQEPAVPSIVLLLALAPSLEKSDYSPLSIALSLS